LALAVVPFHPLAFVGITLSAVGVLSAVPVFYTFPAAFLKGPAAAGGLALVNATGNIGGFVGPILVGWVAQRTGNPASGLLVIAAAVVIAPAIILSLNRKKISEVD
jgi:ACS family tartrate transporter-like MFS transporter